MKSDIKFPDNSDDIPDLWSGIFSTLSVSQFALLWEELGFPISPNEELRDIARNFMLCFYVYIREPIPEQPSINLLDEFSDEDPLVPLWNNTFSHLRLIGYADTVYQWGKQTYENYYRQNNQVSNNLDWDALLSEWTHNSTSNLFFPLSLPTQTKTSLQLTIMEYDRKSRQLRRQIERLEQTSQNKWEELAFRKLRIGSWISLQAQFMTTVRKWNTIFEFLSAEEIKVLEKWGWQQFEAVGNPNRVPLVDFRL